MAFDPKTFSQAKFEPRTKEWRFEDLAEFFGDDEPVFIVRGLDGGELAHCNERADRGSLHGNAIDVIGEGLDADKIEAIKDWLGLGNDVPRQLVLDHEIVMHGCVSPVVDRALSVRLARYFPGHHRVLAHSIRELTGQGWILAKKKPSDSGQTPNTEPA